MITHNVTHDPQSTTHNVISDPYHMTHDVSWTMARPINPWHNVWHDKKPSHCWDDRSIAVFFTTVLILLQAGWSEVYVTDNAVVDACDTVNVNAVV